MQMRLSSRAVAAFSVILAIALWAPLAHAQNAAAVVNSTPAATKPNDAPESRVLSDIVADQRDIWTSPLRLGTKDARWLLPSLAIAAALVGSDKEINQNVSHSSDSIRASDRVSHLGSPTTLFGASGVLYLAGRLTHDEHAKETGLLAFEALVDESIVVGALKVATNRERPDKENGRQDFLDGGKAFPSGHAGASWAFATVVAEQYRDKPLVRWGAYGVAAAVGVARVTALKHSPSDVFVGAAIGFLVGRHVVRRAGETGDSPTFSFAPAVDPATRTYGLAGTLSF